MKIFLDNVNIDSSSGPNGFAKKISSQFKKSNDVFYSIQELIDSKSIPDVQLAFIASQYKFAPIVQRLDGIYFNSEQDFSMLNKPIEATYAESEAVIFQSEFNKSLTEKFFGVHKNGFVIGNGTDIDRISKIPIVNSDILNSFENIWLCASSWRPHKRLKDNIDYFLKNSKKNDCLVVAGENPDYKINHEKILYAGHLSWIELVSLMKKSKYFIHLAWLDHCPNVVVDARAAGCHIICSSSGGTKEIAGLDCTIIQEEEWDLSPVPLYKPPKINFNSKSKNTIDSEIDIEKISEKYIKIFEEIIK